MIDVLNEKDNYLAAFAGFEKRWAKNGRPALHQLRQTAMERFAELGFPTPRDEDWRFTNVAALAQTPFAWAAPTDNVASATLRELAAQAGDCYCLVFVNGHLRASVLPSSIVCDSLAAVLTSHPELVEAHLAQYAKYEDQAFTALNTAFLHDGAFLHLPKGKVLDKPLHLVFAATAGAEPAAAHPRTLIVMDQNSQATVVESYVGLDEGVYFTNAVTEIVLGPNASVDHYKVQRESREAFHVSTTQIQHDRNSRFSSHAVTLGGALVRNDINAVLDAEGCECTLNGLYLAQGRQHVDNHTRIDHAKPHCVSHELYKGILNERARGVFNGKIYVHQDAQKTDAKQTNKTLLLSEDAVIDTKPQLEIYADDVKCTHGATVGQLDETALFYLQARGIGLDEARRLLTYAFANDLIERIKIEPIRAHLERIIMAEQGLTPEANGKEANS